MVTEASPGAAGHVGRYRLLRLHHEELQLDLMKPSGPEPAVVMATQIISYPGS